MRFRLNLSCFAILAALCAVLCAPAHAAEKLKGFYSGSGGLTSETTRVVLLEFGADGTAILEQTRAGENHQVWHAHWTRQGKEVTLTFDPVKDQPTLQPLVFTFKHGTLSPTSWDKTALGILTPPKLTPFAGANVPTGSVATCQVVSSTDPNKTCVTWDSRH
jgi:hypothetical protein